MGGMLAKASHILCSFPTAEMTNSKQEKNRALKLVSIQKYIQNVQTPASNAKNATTNFESFDLAI